MKEHNIMENTQITPVQKTQKMGRATVDLAVHTIDYHRSFIAS
ncbi:MAG: hypothetical protein V1777_02680 [Candidatus Micrarchaeota archaeon]